MWCNFSLPIHWPKHIEITAMRYRSRYRTPLGWATELLWSLPIISSSNSLKATGNPLNLISTILMSWTKPSWRSTLGNVGPDLTDNIGEESDQQIEISLLIRLILAFLELNLPPIVWQTAGSEEQRTKVNLLWGRIQLMLTGSRLAALSRAAHPTYCSDKDWSLILSLLSSFLLICSLFPWCDNYRGDKMWWMQIDVQFSKWVRWSYFQQFRVLVWMVWVRYEWDKLDDGMTRCRLSGSSDLTRERETNTFRAVSKVAPSPECSYLMTV